MDNSNNIGIKNPFKEKLKKEYLELLKSEIEERTDPLDNLDKINEYIKISKELISTLDENGRYYLIEELIAVYKIQLQTVNDPKKRKEIYESIKQIIYKEIF